MNSYPATGVADLFRLASRILGSAARHPRSFDLKLQFHEWMREMTVRHGSANVYLDFLALRLLLVTDPATSRHILADYPRSTGYVAGTPKVKGMTYLAPGALTLAQDDAWTRLRPFNEHVLCTGRPHEYQRIFLGHVRRAFATTIMRIEDVRAAMGAAMLDIVFGEGVAPAQLAADIQVLFGLVQSPPKRLLLGALERRRRDRLYEHLRLAYQGAPGAGQASLLALARSGSGGESVDALLQQVPHWMFTFTGSGTDLLTQGLAMIGSRPGVLERARAEIAAAGPLDQPASIDGLRYLEACLLESARLFPPVRMTFHKAPAGDTTVSPPIPAGTEILQVFTLLQRDGASDGTAHEYRPDRWLGPGSTAAAAYPNLFLSGARQCPGRDLILFVCKAAAAQLLSGSRFAARSELLAADPLPFSFPARSVHFAAM